MVFLFCSKVDIFGTGITKAEIERKIKTVVITQFKSIEECARLVDIQN